jgi:hypothetical protein
VNEHGPDIDIDHLKTPLLLLARLFGPARAAPSAEVIIAFHLTEQTAGLLEHLVRVWAFYTISIFNASKFSRHKRDKD